MKASIITLHAVKNYGSALQTYATQHIFEELGFETEIVDYRRRALDSGSILKILNNNEFGLLQKIKLILILPSGKKAEKTFGNFLENYINMTDKCYCEVTEESDFKNHPIDADVYCTGSDQVWNTGWHKEIPKPFFLTYAPEDKRIISFSASFGKEQLDEWEKEPIRELLSRYDYISVRESSAVNIVNNLGFAECEHVLDPTLVVKPKLWKDLAADRVLKEKYILVYQLNNNKKFDEYAKLLAKKKGLKLVRLCTRYDQLRKIGRGIVLPEIIEFLALFRDAEYVITDSFHATAFSLIFNKKFIDILPGLYNTRLESILALTGLEERVLNDYNDFELIDREIDYEKVNSLLDSERQNTMSFLKKATKI